MPSTLAPLAPPSSSPVPLRAGHGTWPAKTYCFPPPTSQVPLILDLTHTRPVAPIVTAVPSLRASTHGSRRGRFVAWGLLAVAALSIGAVGRLALRETRPALPASITDGEPEAARSEITTILSQHYFSAVDRAVIAQRPITDLPVELDDPYTHFMNQSQYQKFIDEESGRYVGIGIHVSAAGDQVRIDRVFSGSPAALAGLRPGDLLLTIDGHSVKSDTLEQALAAIRGPENEAVNLSVNRDGTAHTVTVTRAKVQGWLVQSEVRTIGTHRVGYLTLLDFSDGVGDRAREAVTSMLADGAEAIVVDLRGNPGGLAKEAVRTAEVFLAVGTPVLTDAVATSTRRPSRLAMRQ